MKNTGIHLVKTPKKQPGISLIPVIIALAVLALTTVMFLNQGEWFVCFLQNGRGHR